MAQVGRSYHRLHEFRHLPRLSASRAAELVEAQVLSPHRGADICVSTQGPGAVDRRILERVADSAFALRRLPPPPAS